MIQVHRIVNTPVPSNCFVIYDKSVNSDCIIVDPGTKDNEGLISYIVEQRLLPVYIILTHEHFDHCWGVNELVEKYQIPIICSELCAECLPFEKRNCSVFYDYKERFVITSKTISVESLNFVLHFADTEFRFFASLGHTNASICFTVNHFLFTGDTLIKDLRTVTKLPTGSVAKLKESLNAIAKLKDQGYTVYAGHGESFLLDDYNLDKAL